MSSSLDTPRWRFKSWFLLLFLAVAILASIKAYWFFRRQVRTAKAFSIEKIRARDEQVSTIKMSPEMVLEANAILNQPFFFLGKGRQCYAFESCDGKYVLKFFQQERFTVKDSASFLPDFFFGRELRARKVKAKEKKLKKMLKSFELAAECLPNETGVLFAHLSPTKSLHTTVRLLDDRGHIVFVSLDSVQFVLQKKAHLLKPTIVELMHQGKEGDARVRISQIFDLLVICNKKGIQDTDGALIRNDNLGFLDDRAIYIDTGKLIQSKQPLGTPEFIHDLRRLRPLHNWLKKNYPMLADHFQECQERAVGQFS